MLLDRKYNHIVNEVIEIQERNGYCSWSISITVISKLGCTNVCKCGSNGKDYFGIDASDAKVQN